MKNSMVAFIVGAIFSVGLAISGMTQPQKVIGFLDLFGNWNPALMFVMVGAISFHFVTYKLIRLRKLPLWSSEWHVPTKKILTPSLMVGSFLFGIGWGLGGFCPGPAVTSLATFDFRAFIFVIGMLIGMLLFRVFDRKLKLQK